MKRSSQYSNLVKHPEHGASDFDKRMNIVQTNSAGAVLRTSVAFLEMRSAFEELINDGRPNKTLNSSGGLDITGAPRQELKDFNSQFANSEYVLPPFSPQYRQMNLVDRDNIRLRLKKFKTIINDLIRSNNINKMSSKIERLAAQDLLFNDLVFVMLSNKYLQYLNKKNKCVTIGGWTRKQFIDETKGFLNTIMKAIKIVENAYENENYVVSPDLEYCND